MTTTSLMDKKELMLIISDTEAADATVPIRWCLNQQLLADLKSRGAKNPYILFVIVRDKTEVTRRLVPIGQMLEYFQFHKSGLHHIMATIVWHDEDKTTELEKKFYGRASNGMYAMRTLNIERQIFSSFHESDCYIHRTECQAELKINIPQGLFARKPFDWAFVNFFFEAPPRDQCHFRKRRFLSYSIAPIYVMIWLNFAFIIGMLRGSREMLSDLDPRKIWKCRGLSHIDSVSWIKTQDSFFNESKSGRKYHLFRRCLRPSIFIVTTIIVLILNGILSLVSGNISFMGWGIVFILAFIVMSIIAGITWICEASLERKDENVDYYEARKKKIEEEKAKLNERYENFQVLACKANMGVAWEDLPKEVRTISLRAKNLKSRVCRPFPL